MNDALYSTRLQALRWRWLSFAGLGVSLLWGAHCWLLSWWQPAHALRWLVLSSAALAYLLVVLWRNLPQNRRAGERELLPGLGLGNLLSLLRGLVLVLFFGFLFSPWPETHWYAWLPGLLYTLAALPDYLDGAAARLTNHVTRLGETLDMTIDSIGVLGVTLLAVQYGQAPWWYLPVGLARYLFLAGIWLRRRRGLPVYELPFSLRRRGYAALTMGLFFVLLYPPFGPPATHLAATIFAVYVLGGFGWDWGVVTGRLPAQPGARYRRIERLATAWLPLGLRLLALVWAIWWLVPRPGWSAPPLALLEAGAAVLLAAGVAGRLTAIVALVCLGLQHSLAPLTALQLGMVVVYANLLFLGSGAWALWRAEDPLIHHRIGDPR